MKETIKTIEIPCVKFYDKVSHRTYEIPKEDFKDINEIMDVKSWFTKGWFTKELVNEILFKMNLNILLTNDGRCFYVTHADFNKIIDALRRFQHDA